MPPRQYKQNDDVAMKEGSPLLASGVSTNRRSEQFSINSSSFDSFYEYTSHVSKRTLCLLLTGCAVLVIFIVAVHKSKNRVPTGPYKLVELQEGDNFFNYYTMYEGADSLGSAGYNDYVGRKRAKELGIANVTIETTADVYANTTTSNVEETFVYMSSTPTKEGPRESIRLEGKRLFNRGLFVIDLRHMPAGCGVWPAFWLTNEKDWPNSGEIDVVEGVNFQSMAKTALHTSNECSMYGHVPGYDKTGTWDWATGIPNTWTGLPDFNTSKEADDCWVSAPHQWGNQGCVAVSSDEGTLGIPFNAVGGGVYALEWDPANKYIRTWAFAPHTAVPPNLRDAIQTASTKTRVLPDTKEWGLPYGYFAIGEGTGCSADHFKNMRLVVNLAFCGTVAGNRYFTDCPKQAEQFSVKKDPVLSCNKWIESNPKEMEEAYWKIKGVYVYQRELEGPQ